MFPYVSKSFDLYKKYPTNSVSSIVNQALKIKCFYLCDFQFKHIIFSTLTFLSYILSIIWPRCEDLAEVIWMNKQQMLQLGMIQDGLNLSNTENYMNILPELSDGLQVLLETLVKRYSWDLSKSGFNNQTDNLTLHL